MSIQRKIQITSNNQFVVTIPKAIAQLLNFTKGTILEYSLLKNLSFNLAPVKNGNKATRMKVQMTKTNQYIITIPKVFAESFNFKKGTIVEIYTEDDRLILQTTQDSRK